VKLAVGYPVSDAADVIEAFVAAVEHHRDGIEEVYFAMPGDASGRSPSRGGALQREALTHLHSLGVRLDLLFNANCYGPEAAGAALADHVCRRMQDAAALGKVSVVTTASPFVAQVVRRRFPWVELRASVNMRIGTVAAMQMAGDLFDGFYVQRDYNRDLDRVRHLRRWCSANGKRLCGLVNSGCLAYCPGQTFHDNLVAHEADADAPLEADLLPCRRHLRDRANWTSILSATWIRPSDLHHYDSLFDIAKLATRMHAHPERVIRAYATGTFRGNLLDLLEPGYDQVAREVWLAQTVFPDDWFQRTTSCGRECDDCGYCASVLARAMAKRSPRESASTA